MTKKWIVIARTAKGGVYAMTTKGGWTPRYVGVNECLWKFFDSADEAKQVVASKYAVNIQRDPLTDFEIEEHVF